MRRIVAGKIEPSVLSHVRCTFHLRVDAVFGTTFLRVRILRVRRSLTQAPVVVDCPALIQHLKIGACLESSLLAQRRLCVGGKFQ